MYIRDTFGLQAISLPGSAPRWSPTRQLRRLIGATLLAISCCALPITARAQTPDSIPASSAPGLPTNQVRGESYSVSGMVIDAATGEPIRKALVQLQTTQQRTTFTDGDGRFQFDGIPAGQVSLTAQKPGYFGEQESGSVHFLAPS